MPLRVVAASCRAVALVRVRLAAVAVIAPWN